MPNKIIAQGAEAKIILSSSSLREGGRGHYITKNRIKKSYRIPELDKKIRKQRTKAEAKLLKKASEIINAPVPITERTTRGLVGGERPTQIKMPFINGKKLSINLDKFPIEKQKQICKKIGQEISKLHSHNIIHGDLTTSNMILVQPQAKINKPETNEKSKQNNTSLTESKLSDLAKPVAKQSIASNSEPIIFFIDFGLGYFNGKIEDKAVDLHLLKQALEAKHFKNFQTLWKSVETGYKTFSQREGGRESSKQVLERLKKVEKRGRYKK